MAIDFNTFLEWAESRFDHVKVKGKEIRLNSIFEEDNHFHLWCSPSGGKKNRPDGVFHCFKSDKKGTLIKLVMMVDDCEHDEAVATLQGEKTIREIEERLDNILSDHEDTIVKPTLPPLALPDQSFLISAMPQNNWWRKKAVDYLYNRRLPYEGLYVCTAGDYKARIIIPYYDRNGKLIYWNARHFGKARLRYLGPPKEVGVGKEDVVYMEHWPEPGSSVYVCEGEFNAKSLVLSGLYGAACGGKSMSEKQATMLKDYKIVLCLDADKPGWQGSAAMTEKLSTFSMRFRGKVLDRIMIVRPPVGYKDWNDMLIKLGPNVLGAYIEKYQRPLETHAPLGTATDYFAYYEL